MSRHTLTFCRQDVTAPNTWWVLPDGKTIHAVIQLAEAPARTVEFQVRFRKDNPDAVHMRPYDAETRTWLLEAAKLHADLPKIEIQLEQAPPMVANHFRTEL